jgi:secreted trypsin-like serine protease
MRGAVIAARRAMLQFLPFLLSSTSVVGGEPVKPGEWRDAVAVLSDGAACTGTLITPDVVLTAGHCIESDPVAVVVGTVDYGVPGGEPIRVKWSLAYPEWREAYDVGIVVLEHPARVKPRAIAAACSIREGLVAGALVHIVGFGLTARSGTGDNTVLHEGEIPVIDPTCGDDAACQPAIAPGGEFIAGGHGVDSCFGDSGGPVYLDTPRGPALVGVVSRASTMTDPPCGNGGVYVRADKVVSWVQRMTHETVERTRCTGAGDADDDSAAAAAGNGGCAATHGGVGNLVIVLGALTVGRLVRRRRRAAQRVPQFAVFAAGAKRIRTRHS